MNGPPQPTPAASARPENHNSEVCRDIINDVSARRDGKYFRIKRALRGKDDYNLIESSAARAVCVRRVLL